MRDLIIVGIDPGTTVAYAALDLEGNILEVYSAKQLSLNDLIGRVIKLGKPLITSTDVASPPMFVEKFATKTGSKLISPDSDLLVKEKESLAKSKKPKNTHQMDALAAALFAHKVIKPMIGKIKSKLDEMGKTNLGKEVLELVIKHDISIKNAVSAIEEPEKEESKIIKKVSKKKILLESDYFTLYKKLKNAEKDIKLLKYQNDNLLKKNNNLDKKNKFLIKKLSSIIPREKTKDLLYFKDKTINNLALKKDEKELEIKVLQHKLLELNKLLLDTANKTLAKKIGKLSPESLKEKKKIFSIKKGDILFVEDLTSFSKKAVDDVKSKISIIVYEKSKKSLVDKLPFTCINAKNLSIKEDDHIALISNDSLEKELGKKDILSKVLEEYRSERTN